MKNISTFALLFLSIFLFSQTKQKQQYVYLKRQTDTTRTFKASIANQPVTIFLKYSGIVDCKFYVYYVDGWYYYDKYKIKIPLTGVYNGGEVTLANFEDKKM